MRRTVVVAVSALFSLAIAGCSTLNAFGAMLGSQVTFTQPQLQRALDRSFPRQYDKVGGLVSLRLDKPSLSIPYNGNRLRLRFDFDVGAPVGGTLGSTGQIAISSGLRFDPETRGLHLLDPIVESVDLASGGGMKDAARELINAWLAGYARDEPVYRLDDTLMQRLASRRIGATAIEHGVVVMEVTQ